MKVILFGATRMVGLGVMRECLLDGNRCSRNRIGRKPSDKPTDDFQAQVATNRNLLAFIKGEMAATA